MTNTTWWSNSSGRIELELPNDAITNTCHSGDNEPAIRALLESSPFIKEQLDKYPNELLAGELAEYGASWNIDGLDSLEENQIRILWLALWDLFEEQV